MPFLNPNAIIAPAKLKDYLLVLLPKDDKSLYLAKAGYTQDNWRQLEQDLRKQILTLEATPTTNTKHGQKYEIIGNLRGVNNQVISVKTIWIVTPTETKFVTLFPYSAGG
jgi:hypothetical protein